MEVDEDLLLNLPTLEQEADDDGAEDQMFGAIDEDLALTPEEEDPGSSGDA